MYRWQPAVYSSVYALILFMQTVTVVTQKLPRPKRLFFALWPTVADQVLFHALARHNQSSEKDRLVAVHNLHLTLSFLGSVDVVTENCAREMAETLVWQPLELDFNRLGWFARPKVLWAGCSVIPTELIDLVNRIQEGVARCGIKTELRPFKPHITLARKVVRAPEQEIETLICRFDELCLVQSQSENNGVSYTNLARWSAQSTGT